MDARLKSVVTLSGLAVLLVIGAAWGWAALTAPLPERSDPPICVDHTFAKGDAVRKGDVTVSVWNAGTRNGLAGLTMELLVDAGFAEGQEGNAPKRADVSRAQIWTGLPADDPAVQLVASHLGQPEVVRRDVGAAGVLVVVGDEFKELVRGKRRVVADRTVEVCGPPQPS
jgi:hypothetical protein